MKELSNCPHCNAKLDSEDIYQFYLEKYSKEGLPDYAKTFHEIEQSIRKYPDIYKDAPTTKELKEMSSLELAAWHTAQMFGWSKKNPCCFRRETGIEIQGVYDGVIVWRCPDCKGKWKRFDWVDDKYLS